MLKSKSSNADSLKELKAWCEAYKTHWESVMRDDLTYKLAGTGLSEVKIKNNNDIEKFRKIKQTVVTKLSSLSPKLSSIDKLASLSTQEKIALMPADQIEFVASTVITAAPTAQFCEVHRDLYIASQSYLAANALLNAKDVAQFKSTFFSNRLALDWSKGASQSADHLISKIENKLGIYASKSKLFSNGASESEGKAKIDKVVDPRKSFSK